MTLKYDYFKNPPRAENEGEPFLHPRPVVSSTLKTEQIAKIIHSNCTFTEGDIMGVLQSLSNAIFEGLSEGQNVHLEGIGTFSVTLTSRPVKDKRTIHAQSIKVKGVEFRADKKLKDKMKSVQLERVRESTERASFTEEQRISRILFYIKENPGINITTTMKLNHCTYQKAKADLTKLIKENKVKQISYGYVKIYSLL